MKEFLPATAVMFFIGRILGGPDGQRETYGQRERDAEKKRRIDKRKKIEGKIIKSLDDGVRNRFWNFRNKWES